MALFLTRWFERNPSQIGGEACHDLIMSAPDLSSSEMKQFAVSGAESHLTILLGAGASTTSGLPDWDTFATRLLLESGSVTDPAIAKLLVERQDPLLVVEAARSAFGDRWNQQLRRALYDDVERLNVTLWIADGEGKLVRWAAQDRLHRDVAVLRRVETGHDSPWVSGQALGAETLLFQDLEESGNGQWRSVLALPIPIPHPDLPTLSAAVLTIGLPEPASRFERTSLLWGEPLSELGNKWGERLSSVAFSG